MKWSLFIHTTLLVLLAMNGFHMPTGGQDGAQQENDQQQEAQNGKNSQIEVEIIDPPKKDSEEQTKDESDPDGILARAPHAADDCKYFFGGIGINEQSRITYYEGERSIQTFVINAHPGYPAANAGIQAGDEILGDTSAIRGEIGTSVTVRIRRNGQLMTFEMTRDKICIDKPETGGNP